MKRILLGVCGGVAAYKAAFLIRLLRKDGCEVRAAMSPAAERFVGAATLQALSGRPAATDDSFAADGMAHISLTREADGFVVAPATADFLAKAAAGIADNLLLSAFLAAECPRFVAPAMNRRMWAAAATQRNIRRLAEDGVCVFPPDSGEQACGETGDGRMIEPAEIAARIRARAHFRAPLAGRRAVVSAGATREKIDDMRVVSNISSGKMGFCIAESLHNAGAEVRIVAGQTSAAPPPLPIRRAMTVAEMRAAVLEECRAADIFVAAAAVSDFCPANPVAGKIPRRRGELVLRLVPAEDILSAATAEYPRLFAVGFAAQSGAAAARIRAGRRKMRGKNAAMFVVNPLEDAGGDSSEMTILTAADEIVFPRRSKREAAAELTAAIAGQMDSREILKEAR
ncbi:MAG: bifunctional phosphopantothenoylcysteine decarboxylase/phosphopantothenate--cysteine ligase CoaBC [Gammaproteobacteria bacterium]